MQDPINPYAAPEHLEPLGKPEMTPAERMRREHLGHEASLQSLGSLYILLGALDAFVAIIFLVEAFATNGGSGPANHFISNVALAVLGGAISFVLIATGRGLRGLHAISRKPAIVLSIVGLAAAPCGTIVNVYALYLLLCRKGQTVFTAEYAEVRRQTPHMKYGMPLWNWIVLAMVAAPIGGLFVWIWLRA